VKLNTDITRLGWAIVGVILAYSGINHMITLKIYTKVRMSDTPPSLEGFPVFFIGLAEVTIGVLLLAWLWRNRG
jgi:hypothetical protein